MHETYWGNVSCTGPRACYDESKRVGETLASIFAQQFDVPVKVGRPFNVFGPIQNLDDKRIFPDFLSATLDKRQISILSDGRATRSFCYVSDAVTAILLILLAGRQGEAYNLGNDQREISVNELAQLFVALEADHAGIVSAKSADQDYETDNPQRRKPDLEKIRRELGYRPLIDLEAGILRTLAAYRS